MPIPGEGTPYIVRAGWSDRAMGVAGIYTFQRTHIFGEPKQGQQLHLICRAGDLGDYLKRVDSEHFDKENGHNTLGDVFRSLFKSGGKAVEVHPDIDKLPIPGGYALRWNQSASDFEPAKFTLTINNDADSSVGLTPGEVFVDGVASMPADGASPLDRRGRVTIVLSDVASRYVAEGNDASRKVLEKAGLQDEGLHRHFAHAAVLGRQLQLVGGHVQVRSLHGVAAGQVCAEGPSGLEVGAARRVVEPEVAGGTGGQGGQDQQGGAAQLPHGPTSRSGSWARRRLRGPASRCSAPGP